MLTSTCFHGCDGDVVPSGRLPVQDLSQSDGTGYRVDVEDLLLVCVSIYREPETYSVGYES